MRGTKAGSGICRLCGTEGLLCDSHILSEFMYRPVYLDCRMVGFKGRGVGSKPTVLQKGFRQPLLCHKCEQGLNKRCEQPNVTIWRALVEGVDHPLLSRVPGVTAAEGTAYIDVAGVEYASFKLLLLLQLWRASVATREEYASVHLGVHEEIIRRMLLDHDPGPQHLYPCILTLFNRPVRVISPMVRAHFAPHSTYQIIITRIALWFFVSELKDSEGMLDCAVNERGTFRAMVSQPEEVPLFAQTMKKIAQIKERRGCVSGGASRRARMRPKIDNRP
jgi:hypothetical protein